MLENEMGNFTAATNKKDYDMVTTYNYNQNKYSN
jgi:hypothetical protein